MFLKNTKLLRTLPQGSQNPGTQTSEKSGHVVLISELPTTGAHQPMMPAECSCRLPTSQSFPLLRLLSQVYPYESPLMKCFRVATRYLRMYAASAHALCKRVVKRTLRSNWDVLNAVLESCKGISMRHCRACLLHLIGPAAALKHSKGSLGQAWSRNCCCTAWPTAMTSFERNHIGLLPKDRAQSTTN